MKTTEIINLAGAFNSLMGEKLPRAWKVAIKANIARIRPILDAYEEQRREVVTQHASDETKIAAELDPLLKQDHPVDLSKMPESALEDFGFTLGQEVALAPMIEALLTGQEVLETLAGRRLIEQAA